MPDTTIYPVGTLVTITAEASRTGEDEPGVVGEVVSVDPINGSVVYLVETESGHRHELADWMIRGGSATELTDLIAQIRHEAGQIEYHRRGQSRHAMRRGTLIDQACKRATPTQVAAALGVSDKAVSKARRHTVERYIRDDVWAETRVEDGKTYVLTDWGWHPVVGERDRDELAVEADMLAKRDEILRILEPDVTPDQVADLLGVYAANYRQWRHRMSVRDV